MPRLPGVGAAEAANIAAWLAAAGEVPAAVAFTDKQAEAGAVRFRELGCITCHVRPGEAAAAGEDRIELRNVPAKWRSAGVVSWLKNPRAFHPDSRMPDFALSDEDAAALAAFLLQGRASEPAAAAGGDVAAGRELAAKVGCARCHATGLTDASTFAPLLGLDAAKGCLADALPPGAPDHGLSPRQRAALRAFLPHAETAPFRKAPADFAARQVRELRCTHCHGLDAVPSTWAELTHQAAEPPPRREDPVFQGVPALTWAAAKLQPTWLERFVTGKEPSPRPWLTARMPRFHQDGPAVVQGLARQHGYPFQDEPPGPADSQLAAQGARLVKQGEGFYCVQCHAIGDARAEQVFDREGVNLKLAAARVRHEYFRRWLLDAPRIDADSRMPKWTDAKGRTAFAVLGGDAVKQFEAIWQYLQTLR
jgi:cytochrome c2